LLTHFFMVRKIRPACRNLDDDAAGAFPNAGRHLDEPRLPGAWLPFAQRIVRAAAVVTLSASPAVERFGPDFRGLGGLCFFRFLKHEWTNHERYADLEQSRTSVFKYIELFYNSNRLHQSEGYQSPNDFEAQHAHATGVPT